MKFLLIFVPFASFVKFVLKNSNCGLINMLRESFFPELKPKKF